MIRYYTAITLGNAYLQDRITESEHDSAILLNENETDPRKHVYMVEIAEDRILIGIPESDANPKLFFVK